LINPPGPTKRETLAIGGGFSFEGYAGGDRRQRFDNMRLQEHVGRQSAATAPRRGESARSKRARNNPPGPTKRETLAIGGGFSFGGVGLDESRCSTNATNGAFGPPQQSEGARRVQSPEAMAIEDNPPGPTKIDVSH
jgi:hypothetical protein